MKSKEEKLKISAESLKYAIGAFSVILISSVIIAINPTLVTPYSGDITSVQAVAIYCGVASLISLVGSCSVLLKKL